MSILVKNLRPGLYGNDKEVIQIIDVTTLDPGTVRITYVWLKGNESQLGNTITVHIHPASNWRLHELPFIIDEWL